MNNKLKKIKEGMPAFFKNLPVLLSRHFTYFVLVGAILALSLGAYFFYADAFQVTRAEYDVFVSVRKVNDNLFEQAKGYIQEQNTSGASIPSNNPFQP
ncbi:MAG: hypothetical protein R3251_01405 [Candidatus Spechtbacterales bacterium]|nr:hypothetical protein [Candidatus Spechtbacterales bacterium]